eukprot:TRINITY_DN2959_c0_g1_i3.p1 TRINITY_DN2959_c0_g1~~TRINITY_DN2959_c0_g1_i3.p1  ORF type:complete len:110 (+),score=11.71 TRINITY_DN2959_c0_g1_i3:50-379(+)
MSSLALNPFRSQVLHWYRLLLRTGKNWKNPEEAQYILNETRTLFRKNQALKNPQDIQAKVFEAEARYQLGQHYNIPYPRPYYAPPRAVAEQITQHNVKPAYMHSNDAYQ